MGKRLLHIFLAILLFISTTGLTINSHFCTGKYKYSALFVQPANCCAKVQGHAPSKDSCQDEANQTPCCKNKASFFKSNQNQHLTNTSVQEIDFPTFKVIASPYNLLKTIKYQWLDIDYLNYKPPLISKDVSILFQIFLC